MSGLILEVLILLVLVVASALGLSYVVTLNEKRVKQQLDEQRRARIQAESGPANDAVAPNPRPHGSRPHGSRLHGSRLHDRGPHDPGHQG
ncbi:hypothetical protein A9404_04040 [Halothiobacillus diazotrophicus]|uniref:Uncharacterized protein n=1 Tax=Halothiobacillus diazotrophicus TaxID=1860122 RepID=A0A191ZFL3_9GAMM|nr:hypothetical protein [Halothiobacillus diazotrophicus]ANJ66658.1 hypothetical protein A9404_04040 [Halothiobacillus diazotrophicus]